MAGEIMCNIGSIPISRILFFSSVLFRSFLFHFCSLDIEHIPTQPDLPDVLNLILQDTRNHLNEESMIL
jgi:hypothetical protein